jgi:hypothetical protein
MVPILEFILYSAVMFIVGAITDAVYAGYIVKISEKNWSQAGKWSVMTGLLAFVWLESLLVYKLTFIFWLIGLYVGTIKAPLLIALVDRLAKRK